MRDVQGIYIIILTLQQYFQVSSLQHNHQTHPYPKIASTSCHKHIFRISWFYMIYHISYLKPLKILCLYISLSFFLLDTYEFPWHHPESKLQPTLLHVESDLIDQFSAPSNLCTSGPVSRQSVRTGGVAVTPRRPRPASSSSCLSQQLEAIAMLFRRPQQRKRKRKKTWRNMGDSVNGGTPKNSPKL